MSDPTPGVPDQPEFDAERPEAPEIPDKPEAPDVAGGDDTMRVPVAPEVSWGAPEPPRAMPWDAPTSAAPVLPPATTPPAAGTPAEGSQPPPAAGVLSAATVGWVVPPPEPVATGKPGWVIASTGIRFVAYVIDGIITGLLILVGVVIALVIAPGLADGGTSIAIAYGVASAGLYYVYFVGSWTGGGQATPGMRLLKLRVANAADGKRLALGPATIRWLALGYIFTVVSVIPALAGLGFLALIWWIVLLITTAMDRMHQGLHDKWAKSVIVRPETAGAGSGLGAACLIIVLILVLLSIIPIIALIFLGSQLSNILSAVGQSI